MAAVVAFQIESILPGIIAVAYYAFVFFFAEISRKLIDVVIHNKNSPIYIISMEFIGTAQMCTCVYENSVIIKHYGPLGFFFVVIALQISGIFLNRGAYITPLPVIEQLWNGKISADKFLILLFAQTIGGFSAFRLANTLWYYSLTYSSDHQQLYANLPCAIAYKVPFSYAFLNELICTFLFRFILHRLPTSSKRYLIPFMLSTFLTFSLTYVGVPGLNPVVTSSRLQGCPGLDLQWFMITYWFCPVVGWLLAARLDNAKFRNKQKPKKS